MIRVGVLRGGLSDEFKISIKTGGNILQRLSSDKYKAVDVLITPDGQWHLNGVPKDANDIAINIDVAFNALHGEHGEDGNISQKLERLGVPYTGSQAMPSALAVNKIFTKEVLARAGIKTPPGMLIEDYRDSTSEGDREEKVHELALKIFKSIPSPWILKPARGGSSILIQVAA